LAKSALTIFKIVAHNLQNFCAQFNDPYSIPALCCQYQYLLIIRKQVHYLKPLSTTNILVFYGPPSLGNKKHYAYRTGKFSHPQSTRTQATHQWTYLRSSRCRCWHRRGRFLRRREYSGPTPCDTLDRAGRHTAWTTSRLGRCLVSVTAQHCSHVSQHNTG